MSFSVLRDRRTQSLALSSDASSPPSARLFFPPPPPFAAFTSPSPTPSPAICVRSSRFRRARASFSSISASRFSDVSFSFTSFQFFTAISSAVGPAFASPVSSGRSPSAARSLFVSSTEHETSPLLSLMLCDDFNAA